MGISNAMLLCFASVVTYGFRDRQRFELVPKISTKMCKLNSQQSSDRNCFCTNTRTHTRQNKPYRLGAVPAEVVGVRGRCCPAATVPVAVAFACGVCCCIAEKSQNKIIHRKESSASHDRPQSKAHRNKYENNTHKAEQSLPAWRDAGRSTRSTTALLSSSDGSRNCRILSAAVLLKKSKI